MVTTTFAVVALGAVLAPGAVATPTWQTDYNQAMTAAVAQQKPMAVFIGQGKTGYEQLVRGGIPGEAGELLARNYVSVYVDTTTESGRSLAGQFELTRGLVISSKDGSKQAVWHKGEVTPTALTGYLNRCCDSSRVVTTTEVRGVAAPVFAPVPTPAPVTVRAAAPQAFPAPQFLPQPFPRAGFPGAPCLTGR